MAATLVLAMCTGCTSTSPNDEFSSSYKEQAAVYESTLEAFDEQIERVIADARAGQSAETQIAMLEQAQREGEMSLESARAAARATVSCLQDAGLEASYIEQTDGHHSELCSHCANRCRPGHARLLRDPTFILGELPLSDSGINGSKDF